jgi:hypothetical protein
MVLKIAGLPMDALLETKIIANLSAPTFKYDAGSACNLHVETDGIQFCALTHVRCRASNILREICPIMRIWLTANHMPARFLKRFQLQEEFKVEQKEVEKVKAEPAENDESDDEPVVIPPPPHFDPKSEPIEEDDDDLVVIPPPPHLGDLVVPKPEVADCDDNDDDGSVVVPPQMDC